MAGGGYLRHTYSTSEIDAVAVYCMQLDHTYLLPIGLIAGRHSIQLRLAPSKNNQQVGINWAKQYELGAIAQLGERRDGIAEAVGSSPTSSTEDSVGFRAVLPDWLTGDWDLLRSPSLVGVNPGGHVDLREGA